MGGKREVSEKREQGKKYLGSSYQQIKRKKEKWKGKGVLEREREKKMKTVSSALYQTNIKVSLLLFD